MLKIRLQRFGRKNNPSFRIVVLEGTEGPKSGNHIDSIGSYNPATKQRSLDKERASHWLSKGAQPSDTGYNMLVTDGVISGKKKNVRPRKPPIVKEVEAPVVEASSPAPEVEAAVENSAPIEEVAPQAEAPKAEEVPAPTPEVSPAEAPSAEETPTT